MKIPSGVVSLCLASFFLAPVVAHGQSLTITLTTSFDPSTGDAYEYADTSSDYSTGYYYDLCTYPEAWGEEDDGTWDFYDTSGNCGSTDSAVSWYFTTTGTTDFVQFSSENYEYIDYYVYQMDGDCGFDGYNCDSYWDAFEMSVLAGDDAGGGGTIILYGPPAIAYVEAQIEETAVAYQGTQCVYPIAESTTYSLKESTSSGYYGAGFKMTLDRVRFGGFEWKTGAGDYFQHFYLMHIGPSLQPLRKHWPMLVRWKPIPESRRPGPVQFSFYLERPQRQYVRRSRHKRAGWPRLHRRSCCARELLSKYIKQHADRGLYNVYHKPSDDNVVLHYRYFHFRAAIAV